MGNRTTRRRSGSRSRPAAAAAGGELAHRRREVVEAVEPTRLESGALAPGQQVAARVDFVGGAGPATVGEPVADQRDVVAAHLPGAHVAPLAIAARQAA